MIYMLLYLFDDLYVFRWEIAAFTLVCMILTVLFLAMMRQVSVPRKFYKGFGVYRQAAKFYALISITFLVSAKCTQMMMEYAQVSMVSSLLAWSMKNSLRLVLFYLPAWIVMSLCQLIVKICAMKTLAVEDIQMNALAYDDAIICGKHKEMKRYERKLKRLYAGLFGKSSREYEQFQVWLEERKRRAA